MTRELIVPYDFEENRDERDANRIARKTVGEVVELPLDLVLPSRWAHHIIHLILEGSSS